MDDALESSTVRLRRLRAEFDEYRHETELDAEDAEETFARLTNQFELAVGLYQISKTENKRLRAENQRLRRLILGMLRELGITDTGKT